MKVASSSPAFRPPARFFRSTDLARDFDDPSALDGYILSEFGKQCFARIAEGAASKSTDRAWRVTGDYGSGKSSFALLLASSLSDHRRLPKRLQAELLETTPAIRRQNYVPLLVVGSREPMSLAITRALLDLHRRLFTRGAKSALEADLEKHCRAQSGVPDNDVTRFVAEMSAKIVGQQKGSGLLLVLDEVGKFLEFAALHPDKQDIYLLQKLSELACRSADTPLLFVCLLHQGFNAYADSLATAEKREWEKVAGRLQEIQFRQPLDQIVTLVGAALNYNPARITPRLRDASKASMDTAIRLGWYGAAASHASLRKQAEALFPIDPLVVPILVRVFQRYSQNERSVFNFLFSYEPLGLQAIAPALEQAQIPFRLHHLYDYIRTNLGTRLAAASYRSHWAVIESVVDSFPTSDALEVQVMKTVGVLNLLNADDMIPTEESVLWAVAGSDSKGHELVKTALRRLRQAKHLYFRGAGRGYCLWPHSSVDIDACFDEAKRQIPQIGSWAKAISQMLDTRPIVARRHYIETGNLRYFRVHYCSVEELRHLENDIDADADGIIYVPLCETQREQADALHLAGPISRRLRDGPIRLVAIPRPLDQLAGMILDSMRWDWVITHTKELNSDRYARDEVARYQADARSRLERAVQEFVGLNRSTGRLELTWYIDGEITLVETSRRLLEHLSELCRNVYRSAPRIHNELVNRRVLSSAAAAARMRLIDCMFSSADKPNLGIPSDKNPPEKSIYLSVLQSTGLHRKIGDHWKLGEPEARDPGHLLPALRAIRQLLEKHADERISASTILAHLRRPPFGLRDGITPILLALVAIADHREIAVYENGTFLRDVGKDAFLRLSKNPERFDVQYCRITEGRLELFQHLVHVLVAESNGNAELLDLVRELCGIVANVPEYARQTKRLGKRAIAVRQAILDAQEPVRLLFYQLPAACGFESFGPSAKVSEREARSFAKALKEAVDEVRGAHAELELRILRLIAQQFDLDVGDAKSLRAKLTPRAETLVEKVGDLKLKAFCLRIADELLRDGEWIESVGSLLGLRPPSKWKDEDEDLFGRELASTAGRFLRAEAIHFVSKGANAPESAIRIALTRPDGSERQRVIFVDTNHHREVAHLKEELARVIAARKTAGLSAASQLLWDGLKDLSE